MNRVPVRRTDSTYALRALQGTTGRHCRVFPAGSSVKAIHRRVLNREQAASQFGHFCVFRGRIILLLWFIRERHLLYRYLNQRTCKRQRNCQLKTAPDVALLKTRAHGQNSRSTQHRYSTVSICRFIVRGNCLSITGSRSDPIETRFSIAGTE